MPFLRAVLEVGRDGGLHLAGDGEVAQQRGDDQRGFPLGGGAGIVDENVRATVHAASPRELNERLDASSSQRDRDRVVVVVAREGPQRPGGTLSFAAAAAALDQLEERRDAAGLANRDLALGVVPWQV